MKAVPVLTLLIFLFVTAAQAAKFDTGDTKTIRQPVNDDLYIAGGTININAPVYGDVLAAGGTISITDSVAEDLIVAGGTITLSGNVGDDIRVAGGTIVITGIVGGDIIVAGGQITISPSALIMGDLIITGGDIIIEGTVIGIIKASGGNVNFQGTAMSVLEVYSASLIINGTVNGESILSAQKIEIGNKARFNEDIRYWTSGGKINFANYQTTGSAVYDETLKQEDSSGPLEMFSFFWILYILAGILLIIIFYFIFRKIFEGTGKVVNVETGKSLGTGILFLIGIPILIALLMITLIGIPAGFILLVLYIMIVMLSHVLSSLVFAHWINYKYNKGWSKWILIFVSIGIYIALKLIFIIPFIGFLLTILIVALALGALILQLKDRTTLQTFERV